MTQKHGYELVIMRNASDWLLEKYENLEISLFGL